jgi:hypothetical protein
MKRYISGLFLLCIFFTACDQEPLFWDIAHEYPPIRPIIEGAPSRIVSLTKTNPVLYVNNRHNIWEFDTNTNDAVWHLFPRPPVDKIKTLATTVGYLFALDWDGNIRKWNGMAWSEPLAGIFGKPEQIFGAGNYLFAGALTGTAGTSNGYCIMAMEETNSVISKIKENTGLLFGADYNGSNYFLATRGDGIYITGTPLSSLSTPAVGTFGLSIAGLIAHNSHIVAVTTGRQIIYYDGSNFVHLTSTGFDFSGAMASWKNKNGDYLLLLGLQNSSGSFGYGYRELVWDSPGDTPLIKVPGEPGVSSVEPGFQYTSAIGKYALTALFVLPVDILDSNDNENRPIVYASTVKDGLWSYRTRGGIAQWNGEDNGR